MSFPVNRPMAVVCPRCKETFNITKEDGPMIVCAYCGLGCEAEWFQGMDGQDCRLVEPSLALCPHGRPGVDFPGVSVRTVDVDYFVPPPPPNDRLDAVMFAVQSCVESTMGVPAEFITVQPSTRFIQQSSISRRYTTVLEQIKHQLSIRTQAEYMGMRLENNRKRMRKRVRQRLRRWTILDEHWTNNPRGDW